MAMRELYELKKQLVEELEDAGKKPLNAASLEMIDTLAHAAKNLCKVIEACEEDEESSRRSYRRSSYAYDRSYDDGGGESMRSMRSYSGVEPGRAWSDGKSQIVHKLEELREQADEPTRRVIDKALREMR